MTEARHLTHQELLAEARERFGDDVRSWSFRCPQCGRVASVADFEAAGADPSLLGQECLGRAAKDGSCNWCAYGLFAGPWFVKMADGHEVPSFALAEATP